MCGHSYICLRQYVANYIKTCYFWSSHIAMLLQLGVTFGFLFLTFWPPIWGLFMFNYFTVQYVHYIICGIYGWAAAVSLHCWVLMHLICCQASPSLLNSCIGWWSSCQNLQLLVRCCPAAYSCTGAATAAADVADASLAFCCCMGLRTADVW